MSSLKLPADPAPSSIGTEKPAETQTSSMRKSATGVLTSKASSSTRPLFENRSETKAKRNLSTRLHNFPVIKQLTGLYQHHFDSIFQQYMNAFENIIPMLDSKDIETMRARIKDHQKQLVDLRVVSNYGLFLWAIVAAFVSFYLSVTNIPSFIQVIFQANYLPNISIFDWCVCVFISLEASLLLWSSIIWPLKLRVSLGLLLVLANIPIFAITIISRQETTNISVYMILLGLLAAICTWAVFFLLLRGYRIIDTAINLIRRYCYPDAVLVHCLVDALAQVSSTPINQQSIVDKTYLISRLEECAICTRIYLNNRMPSHDITTRVCLNKIANEISLSFREKKLWVITPNWHTHDNFIKYISMSLKNVVYGNWDALERIKPEMLQKDPVLSHSQRWVIRFKKLLTTITVALLPILGFWILQFTSLDKYLKLSETISNYVVVGAFLWAAVSLIAAVDPQFSTKITGIKGLTELFPTRQ